MTISFVAAAAGEDIGAGGQVTIPSAVTAGDRMLAIIETNANSGQSHGTPPGWILVKTSQASVDGGSQFASLFTKIADANDADSTVVFPVSPSGTKDPVAVAAYNGTVTTPVIAASGVLPHSGVATTDIVVPVINVPELPATLVTAASKKGGSVEITMTAPAGFSAVRAKAFATGGGACACAIADAAAGATGNTAVGNWGTSVSSAAATAFLVALTEGSPPPLLAPVFRRLINADTGEWYPPLA